ncbi:hypothetical protein NKR23_g7403 [Pleurostoma richardsiae]|uniref:Uncharacterized protein n=1 Tax=Pleurostoma richardsiae TaxID=41990 RepID=A0AA38RLT9_9PEZI|nr:hypothetical protein NKR23_g7403 [Pleurostoma richardsiae]
MLALQPNMQVQEDLAALFSRNLTLNQVPPPPPPEDNKIVYISQHYTHSAHLAKQQQEQQERQRQERPSSEPPVPDHQAVQSMLRQHGVDTSALSASQIQLFKSADDSQKFRLIQLWTICPPTTSVDNPTLAWTVTSVEKEEILARMRLERKAQEELQQHIQLQQAQGPVMSLDGTPVQAGDGRWIHAQHYMEPYMASGYEQLARRDYEESARRGDAVAVVTSAAPPAKDVYSHFGTSVGGPTYKPATDPVYDWTSRQQAMENQYGAFQRSREDEEML